MTLLITLLPPEIHLLIATYLFFPDLIHLKISCSYFYDLIPPLTHPELLQAETTEYAITRNICACRYCLRLRTMDKFADRMFRRGRGRYGRDAWKRFCVECGLAPRSRSRSGEARYGPGAQVVIQGVFYVLCVSCGRLGVGSFDRWGKGREWCEGCWMVRDEDEGG